MTVFCNLNRLYSPITKRDVEKIKSSMEYLCEVKSANAVPMRVKRIAVTLMIIRFLGPSARNMSLWFTAAMKK